MSVGGRVGQLTWTTFVERDSHSQYHSVWEELVVTQLSVHDVLTSTTSVCTARFV